MLDPKLFMQIDITTPLRLSPKVFINREDDNYFLIGLFDEKEARKFLNHFLTVIHTFTDYMAPEQLMTMWPPETVNDCFKAIISLKKYRILLTETEYNEVMESITSKASGEEKEFIKDEAWLEAHLKAIKTIPDDRIVLDYGSKGAGYLVIEIAKTGVNKAIATSDNVQNALIAKRKAKQHNLSNVDFLACKPVNISPICYAEKFNLLFTELYCNGIFEERILESVLYAKQNLLSEDCIFMPSRMDVKVFAYDSAVHRDMVQESKEFEILYNFKFDAFTKAMSKHVMGIYTRLTPEDTKKLSEDVIIKSFDFKTLKEATFNEIVEIEITQPGKLTGFCTYFELYLTEDIKISNSPFDKKTKYMQRIFTPAASIYPDKGDKIKINAFYDGIFRVLFAD
ncbi:MAG: hypothetical protein AB1782_05660 [Cyanobacteriota bacterium]